MNIRGSTQVIVHIGFPTHTFKSPMIYNPYFAARGIDCVVVPMACEAEHFSAFLPAAFKPRNVIGALITMPHKVSVVPLLDEVSATVRVAGACNAVRRGPNGQLQGDMFDGEGFVRGVLSKGFRPAHSLALIVGSGGVGSAIAASLAKAGTKALALYDPRQESSEQLAQRLRAQYPQLAVTTGAKPVNEAQLIVNASPLGMNDHDPLPLLLDVVRPGTLVADVVMKQAITPFLAEAKARGCPVQIGTDMLFEQIPAYLEYFGLPSTSAEHLQQLAQLSY